MMAFGEFVRLGEEVVLAYFEVLSGIGLED
jgi:hypothetical protein